MDLTGFNYDHNITKKKNSIVQSSIIKTNKSCQITISHCTNLIRRHLDL